METKYCNKCKCTQLINDDGFCSICHEYISNKGSSPVPEERINRTNISEHLVKYELKMVGKTLVDTLDNDKWFFDFTMTTEQEIEFRNYTIPLLKKVFRCNKGRAEKAFAWFHLQYGLRVKNE